MYLIGAMFDGIAGHLVAQLYLSLAAIYGCAAWAHVCRVHVPWLMYGLMAAVHGWLGLLYL